MRSLVATVDKTRVGRILQMSKGVEKTFDTFFEGQRPKSWPRRSRTTRCTQAWQTRTTFLMHGRTCSFLTSHSARVSRAVSLRLNLPPHRLATTSCLCCRRWTSWAIARWKPFRLLTFAVTVIIPAARSHVHLPPTSREPVFSVAFSGIRGNGGNWRWPAAFIYPPVGRELSAAAHQKELTGRTR